MKKTKSFIFFNEHPKTCAQDDFWGQVKRTVKGEPISQDQIDMIDLAVLKGLKIKPDDLLLDLCCGNGALTRLFFAHCKGGVGVDFSETLIDVAHKYFHRPPAENYLLCEVIDYLINNPRPERFNKAICYGSFPYLSSENAERLLSVLRERFVRIERFFIGNLPDKDRILEFYKSGNFKPGVENDPDSPIGIWRSKSEMTQLAASTGWDIEFRQMPKEYYAAHYRYDTVLFPK